MSFLLDAIDDAKASALFVELRSWIHKTPLQSIYSFVFSFSLTAIFSFQLFLKNDTQQQHELGLENQNASPTKAHEIYVSLCVIFSRFHFLCSRFRLHSKSPRRENRIKFHKLLLDVFGIVCLCAIILQSNFVFRKILSNSALLLSTTFKRFKHQFHVSFLLSFEKCSRSNETNFP